MITTTRCPSCKTRFRVLQEQLQAADGWVRCGHCTDIFDATLSLHREAEAPPAQVQTPAEPVLVEPVPPVEAIAPWGDAAADPERIQRRQTNAPEDAPDNAPADGVDRPADPEPEPQVGVAAEPEFVRQARRRAFWHHPATRVVLGVCSAALLLVLLGQWALHQRDRLAATDPTLQPHLARLCGWLGCELRPWRQIDALRIDSATLLHKKGDDYLLDVVLQNQAHQTVALPAVELSLTDAREHVLVRRVLLPAELSSEVVVPAQGQLSLSVPLQVKLTAGQTMAGYRTLIFYP